MPNNNRARNRMKRSPSKMRFVRPATKMLTRPERRALVKKTKRLQALEAKMLSPQEAIRDTLDVNTARLQKLNFGRLRKLAVEHKVIDYKHMKKVELVKQLASIVTIEDFEQDGEAS